MSSAVLDAGPLIHLSELNALDVLSDFEILFVPPIVWDEVAQYQPLALEYAGLNIEKTENPFVATGLARLSQLFSLDKGEIQSLAVMENNVSAIFLTDDSAARLVAEEIGHKVHGTLGMLIRAVRKGHRSPSEVLNILRNLKMNSTLHIRSSVLLNVIERLEKEWQIR